MYLPPDSEVRNDQRFVVGVIDYPVTRSANIVVCSSPWDTLPQCAISWREMVNVTMV